MQKGLLIILLISLLLLGCSGDKFMRRKIIQKNLVIEWYYHSLITNNTPDIVTVNGQEIYKSREIADVSVSAKMIMIQLYGDKKFFHNYIATPDSIFGYQIKIDSSGTYEDGKWVPDGRRE